MDREEWLERFATPKSILLTGGPWNGEEEEVFGYEMRGNERDIFVLIDGRVHVYKLDEESGQGVRAVFEREYGPEEDGSGIYMNPMSDLGFIKDCGHEFFHPTVRLEILKRWDGPPCNEWPYIELAGFISVQALDGTQKAICAHCGGKGIRPEEPRWSGDYQCGNQDCYQSGQEAQEKYVGSLRRASRPLYETIETVGDLRKFLNALAEKLGQEKADQMKLFVNPEFRPMILPVISYPGDLNASKELMKTGSIHLGGVGKSLYSQYEAPGVTFDHGVRSER
jgi:hypothetical protein